MLRVIVLFLAFVSFALCCSADDSAAVQAARRERERRANIKAGVRVFTNKDIQDYLAKHPSIPASEHPEEENSAQTQTQTAEAPDAYQQAEQYWRGRYSEVLDRTNTAKDRISQLQAQADELTAAFYATSIVSDRERINDARNKLLEEMETQKTELAEANKAMDDLQEEARKAGALPGWLRD